MEAATHRRIQPDILLCGPTCAGKTTIASTLTDHCGYTAVRATEVLASIDPAKGKDRRGLQAIGRRIESETRGQWLAAAAASVVEAGKLVVVDSARTEAQLKGLIDLIADCRVVFVDCDRVERRSRFDDRRRTAGGYLESSFVEVEADPIEREIHRLRRLAAVTIDTSSTTQDAVVASLISNLRSYARTGRP